MYTDSIQTSMCAGHCSNRCGQTCTQDKLFVVCTEVTVLFYSQSEQQGEPEPTTKLKPQKILNMQPNSAIVRKPL